MGACGPSRHHSLGRALRFVHPGHPWQPPRGFITDIARQHCVTFYAQQKHRRPRTRSSNNAMWFLVTTQRCTIAPPRHTQCCLCVDAKSQAELLILCAFVGTPSQQAYNTTWTRGPTPSPCRRPAPWRLAAPSIRNARKGLWSASVLDNLLAHACPHSLTHRPTAQPLHHTRGSVTRRGLT